MKTVRELDKPQKIMLLKKIQKGLVDKEDVKPDTMVIEETEDLFVVLSSSAKRKREGLEPKPYIFINDKLEKKVDVFIDKIKKIRSESTNYS